jgi:hypothetical protein
LNINTSLPVVCCCGCGRFIIRHPAGISTLPTPTQPANSDDLNLQSLLQMLETKFVPDQIISEIQDALSKQSHGALSPVSSTNADHGKAILTALRDKGFIATELSVVRVQVTELTRQAEWQTKAIRGLILGEARAPTLFIVVPDEPVAKLEKFKRLFLVSPPPLFFSSSSSHHCLPCCCCS